MTVSTSDTERKDSYVYHVIRETTDILYDYGDSDIRGTYKTLEDANEAARRDLFKEDEYKKADLEDYSESTKHDGTVLINAGYIVYSTLSLSFTNSPLLLEPGKSTSLSKWCAESYHQT